MQINELNRTVVGADLSALGAFIALRLILLNLINE